tara:strand:- start:427 stop:669 length:243 start_codon:yes stop_codon:yes gene_type:complete
MTKEKIHKIISEKFNDSIVEVHDVNNDNNHFSLLIVSDQFKNMTLIHRHKEVYKLFKNYLTKDIHALQIKTYTKIEWENN